MDLLDALLRDTACAARFTTTATLQGMLDFEAALAAAEAAVGVIPAAAAAPIAAACDASLIDREALRDAAGPAGNLAIPLVKQLTAQVKQRDEDAARFVHWGATSQDAIDTGLMLQLRGALDDLDADLSGLIAALVTAVRAHRDTVMVGRTWMQHALPITFGLKLAGTLDAVWRLHGQLGVIRAEVPCLQFGGAAGTLASLGDKGAAVSQRLAVRLGLNAPATPWHGQRDRIARVAAFAATLTGTLGKLARDVSLMAQTEISEVAEAGAPGRGGSSTMPHKRNPVGCAVILAAAQRTPHLVATIFSAMPQEHERGLGGWHAEWETLPDLLMLCGGALDASVALVEGLEVFPERMRANLGATRSLIMAEAVTMALGASIGRLEAHRIVETKCREAVATGRELLDVLRDDPMVTSALPGDALTRLFSPDNYLGAAGTFVDRVLAQVATPPVPLEDAS
ncbi:3-carboxy-cis,cis-muconate cycloisomerase [Pandoraea terrae]|uniref:3-carboxy-cis,cis-muconate cycloisomerase n=1 Tax=Pandoraea terrae TaxID=1537710 RepID=A0A5E4SLC7_9BURK|nr:3-carboxy-cis,cis-muconate cycloisomerase [Pandoraea terrae]VVD75961.1 3-carboxy-cis,cis-muconate cycloisomerase [Pandoraea terrae]